MHLQLTADDTGLNVNILHAIEKYILYLLSKQSHCPFLLLCLPSTQQSSELESSFGKTFRIMQQVVRLRL